MKTAQATPYSEGLAKRTSASGVSASGFLRLCLPSFVVPMSNAWQSGDTYLHFRNILPRANDVRY